MRDKIYKQAYYEVFIITIIITWLPFKSFAYLAPIIVGFWFLFRTRSGITFIKISTFVLLFIFIIFTHFLIYKGFIIFNSFLFLITYSSFIFILFIPKQIQFTLQDYFRYAKIFKFVLFVQASLGILQLMMKVMLSGGGIDGSAGDVVQGTIKPLSFIGEDAGFGNQMFAINMVFLLLFLTPYTFIYRKAMFVYSLGVIALFLSSVVHVFIAIVLATGGIFLFFRRKVVPKLSMYHLVAIFILVTILLTQVITQPRNFASFGLYAKSFSKSQSPKVRATQDIFNKVSQEYSILYLIGLGPGQYSSKAGLIGSGHYFGNFYQPKKIPFFPREQSNPFRKYVFALWEQSTHPSYGSSTMNRPFYSLLSIFSEFGLIFFLLILFLVYRRVRILKKYFLYYKYFEKDKVLSLIKFVGAIGILFLLGLAFFENYLETPQAIFVGILMLIFLNKVKES